MDTPKTTPPSASPAPNGEPESGQDWGSTLDSLMNLAKEASASFDYDRALGYLTALEETLEAQNIPEYRLESRMDVHREKAKIFAFQGRLTEAVTEYQKILHYCNDNRHLAIKSETFTQIGQLLGKQGDYDRALGYHQRAIGAYRRLGDTAGLCRALRNLGVIYVELGEFEEAEATYDEAIALASRAQEEMLYADLVNNLGTIMNMRGNWKRALDLYRESLGIYRSSDEIRKSAYTMNNLAITFAEQGILEDAFHYFEKAYATAQEIKDSSLSLIVDINLADLHLKKGNPEQAKEHCRKAEEHLGHNALNNGHLAETKKIAGKIAFVEQDYEASLQYYNAAYDLAREIGVRFQEAEILFERGTLYNAIERHFDALTDLEASYGIFASVRAEHMKSRTVEAMGSIEELYLQVFDSIARSVDRKDKYTKGHSDRVASLSLLLAQELGLPTNMLKTVAAGALLHDIGKIKIDDALLKKEGKLTPEEYRAIQKHPELGIGLLRGKEFPWDIRPILLHHHEKFDGTGYPAGLAGEDIPLGARIVGIADVFDALTSDRVYRKAFSIETTLTMMREDCGVAFDPELFDVFERMVRKGMFDQLINSHTSEGEVYRIWMRCLSDQPDQAESPRVMIRV